MEEYIVDGNQKAVIGDYYIEPDVSAACYFYAMAAVTGGKITVRNVFESSVQGDMKFLNVLAEMGCLKFLFIKDLWPCNFLHNFISS